MSITLANTKSSLILVGRPSKAFGLDVFGGGAGLASTPDKGPGEEDTDQMA
jgi:hypothetical protein